MTPGGGDQSDLDVQLWAGGVEHHMRCRTRTLAVGLALLASQEAAGALIGRLWSFEERTAQADLVVIASVVATRDTGARASIVGVTPPFPVVEVRTEFAVRQVLKGAPGGDRIVLRHYRYDWARLGPGGVINGPLVLDFSVDAVLPSDYLLFLEQDIDGTFSPVAGQVFPGESVFELRRAR